MDATSKRKKTVRFRDACDTTNMTDEYQVKPKPATGDQDVLFEADPKSLRGILSNTGIQSQQANCSAKHTSNIRVLFGPRKSSIYRGHQSISHNRTPTSHKKTILHNNGVMLQNDGLEPTRPSVYLLRRLNYDVDSVDADQLPNLAEITRNSIYRRDWNPKFKGRTFNATENIRRLTASATKSKAPPHSAIPILPNTVDGANKMTAPAPVAPTAKRTLILLNGDPLENRPVRKSPRLTPVVEPGMQNNLMSGILPLRDCAEKTPMSVSNVDQGSPFDPVSKYRSGLKMTSSLKPTISRIPVPVKRGRNGYSFNHRPVPNVDSDPVEVMISMISNCSENVDSMTVKQIHNASLSLEALQKKLRTSLIKRGHYCS